jgi:hypothetical protein
VFEINVAKVLDPPELVRFNSHIFPLLNWRNKVNYNSVHKFFGGFVKTLVLFGVLAAFAAAAPLSPTSYTASPGQCGAFCYLDETGSQLTDGVFGVNNWQADLGNGPAYEWVGWSSTNPTITFNFSAAVSISQIFIGFNRTENVGINLPSSVTINGNVFGLTGSEIADGTRGDLGFTVNLQNVTSVTIDLADLDATKYIFADEFQFVDAAPEPSTFVLLSSGIGALAMWRRRKAS